MIDFDHDDSTTVAENKNLSGNVGPLARMKAKPVHCAQQIGQCVHERHGLEIGGPSPIFARDGKIPVYPNAANIDNVVFAHRTVWHDTEDKFNFDNDRPPGKQLILEGGTLPGLKSGHYQFIMSSHMLEHLANPIGALKRWRELLVPAGHLLLIVPHRDRSFDRYRSITTLEHLQADAKNQVGEDDTTHVEETVNNHDYDWGQGTDRSQFQDAIRDNFRQRLLHHHVFDTELLGRLLDLEGFQLLALEPTPLFHIVALAQVCDHPNNNALLGSTATWRKNSPFPSDRS